MTRNLTGLMLCAVLAATGCGGGSKAPAGNAGDPDDPVFGNGSGGSGLGSSTAAPTGTPWTKPADLTIGDLVLDSETVASCLASNATYGETSDSYVSLCLPLYATSTITVTLPPGLVFVAADVGTQNGVILKQIAITVPGGTWTYAVIRAFCVNAHRSGSFLTDTYGIGPVTDVAALTALAALVAGKDLAAVIPAASLPAGYADYEGGTVFDFLQDMVWKITEGGALTAADEDAIAQLPAVPP